MGNAESASEDESAGKEILAYEVDCSPCIAHPDIASFRYKFHDRLVKTDRRLLQETLSLVTSENKWVWRDAEITVYGVNLNVDFYSGARTNKFVVQLDSKDQPTHVSQARGWRLWIRDGFKTAWGWIGGAVRIAGSLTGPLARLAIDM